MKEQEQISWEDMKQQKFRQEKEKKQEKIVYKDTYIPNFRKNMSFAQQAKEQNEINDLVSQINGDYETKRLQEKRERLRINDAIDERNARLS